MSSLRFYSVVTFYLSSSVVKIVTSTEILVSELEVSVSHIVLMKSLMLVTH